MGLRLWDLGRHDWGEIHFWLAVSIGALMLLHVALHWAWVCTLTRKWLLGSRAANGQLTPRARNLYGLGFLIVLVGALAAFMWIARNNVVAIRGERRGGAEQHAAGGHEIRGSMTLADVERATGVPAAVIVRGLGLPDGVSPDERLGRLRREHGFSMSDVRRIVEEHRPP